MVKLNNRMSVCVYIHATKGMVNYAGVLHLKVVKFKHSVPYIFLCKRVSKP